jgi:hypothetical protein
MLARLDGDSGLEVVGVVGDGLQSLPRRHDLVVGVGFAHLAFRVDPVDCEVAGPVEVEIGIEQLTVESIDGAGVVLRDMAVAHQLADDGAVLGFDQRIVIGLARPGFGEFNAQLFEQLGDVVVDILRSGIGMKTADGKGKAVEQQRDNGGAGTPR